MIASITTPPARTAWTTDSGTSVIAAICSSQEPAAIAIPTEKRREENNWRPLRSG